jgi:TolB-like protein
MRKLFDTEFERMVALAATDLDMTLEFTRGVQIIDTWGYQHQIDGNKIYYKLPGLHIGDYETILVSYRLLAEAARGLPSSGEKELARFTVTAKDLFGRQIQSEQRNIGIVISENAADGISSGMLLHSGTMLNFAKTITEIGELYYAGQDDLAALYQVERDVGYREPSAAQQGRMDELKGNFLRRLETALRMTRDSRLELENVRLRIGDKEAFKHELEILVNYDNILSRELADSGGSPGGNFVGIDGPSPVTRPSAQPSNLELLQNRLTALYKEIGLSFPAGQRSIAALAPFSMRGVDEETPLLAFINESALVSLAQTPGLTLVERTRLDAVRAEQNLARQGLLDTDDAIEVGKLLGAHYIVTGQVIPMSAQVIIFARVIHVQTGEIISAAQVFVENSIIGGP